MSLTDGLTEPVTCSTCGAVSVNGGTMHCNRCFERAEMGIGEGITRPHHNPKDCPTYYDGCNCTVEVLVHNIERAEKAEARVAELEAAGREVAAMVNEIIEKVPEAHAIIRSHALKATTFKT